MAAAPKHCQVSQPNAISDNRQSAAADPREAAKARQRRPASKASGTRSAKWGLEQSAPKQNPGKEGPPVDPQRAGAEQRRSQKRILPQAERPEGCRERQYRDDRR